MIPVAHKTQTRMHTCEKSDNKVETYYTHARNIITKQTAHMRNPRLKKEYTHVRNLQNKTEYTHMRNLKNKTEHTRCEKYYYKTDYTHEKS